MKAILLIDHGSRRGEANHMLACMATLVQHLVGEQVVVRHAHMELAGPDIAAGVSACVEAGADEVIVFPYMLSPGRHSTSDIPHMAAQAAAEHSSVRVRVTPAFGVHEKLAEVILERAGIAPLERDASADRCRCWEPGGETGRCGAACRALPDEIADVTISEPSGAAAGGRA